jgi:hypothetical protein
MTIEERIKAISDTKPYTTITYTDDGWMITISGWNRSMGSYVKCEPLSVIGKTLEDALDKAERII